ncbi:hypothetical protein KKH15_00320 [Patescibacteria group bacterium]|nr:hypothetical protein [Patescibacteria group bacterium]MBU1754752.1 hypothetical protein [Patescibacteria group bacterium]
MTKKICIALFVMLVACSQQPATEQFSACRLHVPQEIYSNSPRWNARKLLAIYVYGTKEAFGGVVASEPPGCDIYLSAATKELLKIDDVEDRMTIIREYAKRAKNEGELDVHQNINKMGNIEDVLF